MILYRRTGETEKRGKENGEKEEGERENEILGGWRGYPAGRMFF